MPSRGYIEDLHNPHLFTENRPGEYTYNETPHGKHAEGNLVLEDGVRNPYEQRNVGGEDRRTDDDGGHLIGNRFGGSGQSENMDPQNSNLNRSSYKINENNMAESLESGDKVFASRDTYKSNGSERPDAFMGYNIIERPDGTRDADSFSYQNESPSTQDSWAEIGAKESETLMNQPPNPMEEYYKSNDYNPAKDGSGFSNSPNKQVSEKDAEQKESNTSGRDATPKQETAPPEHTNQSASSSQSNDGGYDYSGYGY